VVEVAVGFDDQPLFTPEEVDQMGAEPNIYLGFRHAMTPTKPQEVGLEVTPGSISTTLVPDRQTYDTRLPDGPAQVTFGKRPGPSRCQSSTEIRDGTSRSRDRNAATHRHLARPQDERPMHADSPPPRPSPRIRDDDINWPVDRLQQAPQTRRAAVAYRRAPMLKDVPATDSRASSDCEDRCHRATLGRER
jgi:hypothetical protein